MGQNLVDEIEIKRFALRQHLVDKIEIKRFGILQVAYC
jgi:hypothetical protein